jgi:hypothetical protein
MVGISLFILWSTALAGFSVTGGAGNCGNFAEAVNLSEDGYEIRQMIPTRDSGGVVITKNLRISGGWFPTVDCNENNQVFSSTADFLAWGFQYQAPITRSGLENSGSVLTIEDINDSNFPQLNKLVIENLSLQTNGTPVEGGGINGVISDGAEILIDNVVFNANYARDYGGGIKLEIYGDSELVIEDSEFVNNEAADFSGGGLYIEVWDNSKLTIERTTILQNQSVDGAGFEIHLHDNSEVVIRDSMILNNLASSILQSSGAGGRIIMEGGHLSIYNTTFEGNDAGPSGGGLYIEMDGGEVTIANSQFISNSAQIAGGGLFVESIGQSDADVLLINNHFTENLPNDHQFVQTGSGNLNVSILDKTIYLPVVMNNFSSQSLWAKINDISLDADLNYVVDFQTNFVPNTSDVHVHFFFDTVEPQYAGTALCPFPNDLDQCKWKLYGGPSPFTNYSFADRPDGPYGAESMCILVADSDHSVRLGTGNCVELP